MLVAFCRKISYCSKFLCFGLQKLDMIVNHRLLSSPMIVNQWHSEMMNQPLVPTLLCDEFIWEIWLISKT